MTTKIQILRPDLYTEADLLPKTAGSAGIDLKIGRAPKGQMDLVKEGVTWPYNDLVGTGLAVAIPQGYVGLLIPRSSAGHKRGIVLGTTVGVIDSDYRGELMLSLKGSSSIGYKEGEAIAQLLIVPVQPAFQVVASLDDTVRGAGGFGSTDLDVAIEAIDVALKEVRTELEDPHSMECGPCLWSGPAHHLVGEFGNLCPNCSAVLVRPKHE